MQYFLIFRYEVGCFVWCSNLDTERHKATLDLMWCILAFHHTLFFVFISPFEGSFGQSEAMHLRHSYWPYHSQSNKTWPRVADQDECEKASASGTKLHAQITVITRASIYILPRETFVVCVGWRQDARCIVYTVCKSVADVWTTNHEPFIRRFRL